VRQAGASGAGSEAAPLERATAPRDEAPEIMWLCRRFTRRERPTRVVSIAKWKGWPGCDHEVTNLEVRSQCRV